LPDAILRRERRGSLFHREPLGLVGEVGARRVEDRIVVAPPQLERHLAGDRARDPALRGLAEHHGLGIEPAPLVEQPSEPAAAIPVLLDRVLVVDAGDEPLVGDVQERHSGRLVDPAALGLDDPVLDLVAHADAMAAADRVGFEHERPFVREADAVERDRTSLGEANRNGLRPHDDVVAPERDAP
jgi:hypothetical protein